MLPEHLLTLHELRTGPEFHGVDIANSVFIDERRGPVLIGNRSLICHGAVLEGPLVISSDCLIGNYVFIRGNTFLGKGVRIGFATEVKGAVIDEGATIGPQCFIADSIVSRGAYLGAQVRTSNNRLDGDNVSVHQNGDIIDTGREKLGCFIGEGVSLGVQVIILPGRVIASGTRISPRVTVERNLPSGHYRLHQEIIRIDNDGEQK